MIRISSIEGGLRVYWEVSRAVHGRTKMTVKVALGKLSSLEDTLFNTHPLPHAFLKRVHELQDRIIYAEDKDIRHGEERA